MTTKFYKTSDNQPMGEYQPTPIDERKKKADILIEYANGGSFTIRVQNPTVDLSKLGKQGIKTLNTNVYEVTENKLSKLQKKFDVQPNF